MPARLKRPKHSSSIQVEIKFKSISNQFEFKLNSSLTKMPNTAALDGDNRHHPGSFAAKHTRKRGLTSEKLKDLFEVFYNPSGIYLPEYARRTCPGLLVAF